MIRLLVLSGLLVASTPSGASTVSVAQESFSNFAALGLRAGGGDGTLDSRHWQVLGASDGDSQAGDSRLSGDFARGLSPGGVRAGGLYAFSLPGDQRGIGIQATATDFTPGALIWSVTNQTRDWLSHLVLVFELWWLNDGARASVVRSDVSFDASIWLPLLDIETPLHQDSLGWQFTSLVATLGWDANAPEASAQAQELAPGATFALRWAFDDVPGRTSGTRDEFALASPRVFGLTAQPDHSLPVIVSAPPTFWLASVMLLLGLCRVRVMRLSKNLTFS